MKLLLSGASLKMAEQQAQQQNVTVDDIVKNETLFGENQKTVEFRNEKIEGDRATIEVKNSFNSWDIVPFIREEGNWKIDKQGIATQMQQQNDFDNKKLDEMINKGNPQDGAINPTMPQDGNLNPTNSPNLTIDPTSSADTSINPGSSPSIVTNQSVQP